MLTGIWASGTYVTMSQGQWQRTQLPKDYVHLVRMPQVRVYACCHLSRYIVSVMSCTLVLSPQLSLLYSDSQYSTEFHLDYRLRPAHSPTSDQERITVVVFLG